MNGAVKTYFTIMNVVDMIVGILLCITIIGAIIGVPLIIGGSKFGAAKNMTESELIMARGNLFGWGIFSAIAVCGTLIGSIIVIVFAVMVNNYIIELENGKHELDNKSFSETIKGGAKDVWESTKEIFDDKPELNKITEELNKAKKMYDDGVITEEEYQTLRKKILKID